MEESAHLDRLSELPQSLIHHILSFLPLKDVVSTTILSKRWVNLWTTVPCLNLIIEDLDGAYESEDDVDRWKRVERLVKFIDRALILWKGVKILKFKISVEYTSPLSLVSDVNVWTLFAVNNKVEELEINTDPENWAPQCLNSCSSLRRLTLVGCNVQMLKSPSWNLLENLRMEVFLESPISGDLINQILLGSPVLEVFELQLGYHDVNLNITSRSLKKLKIENYLQCKKAKPSNVLRICCPNLETLEIIGLFGKCLFTDVSSLRDVTVYFIGELERLNEFGETLKQVFSTIQHVEKVQLSDFCVQVFCASHKKYLYPPLPNVKFLELELHDIQFGEMMDLFGIFPNVKMLVIINVSAEKPLDSNMVNYMESELNLLLELKTVEILSNFQDFSIFWFIEFLLKNAVKLEKMVLYTGFTSYQQKELFEISQKLLGMPRSSPAAKVILKNK